MLNLLGEYDCKLDSKGRMMFPSGLKKQLQEVLHEGFVVNRDLFDKCLVIYPKREWEEVARRVGKLNRFVAKNVRFMRRFNNGATPVELDGAGRILLPASLTAYAELEKEVKVTGSFGRIEVWSKANYEAALNEDVDLGALSEEVMGGADDGGE
ncbi:MAG TPA: division/cell wall cluster transcriptional repressor MraZ [Cryomorphaceae bacterium]|nr:division/cell wall cluster transcriptional repressor MraZ [Cryomorphaceae bacterium]